MSSRAAPLPPYHDADLQRFVDAQAPVFAQVLAELARGRKTSHWMWFVFPQLRGLGHSAMATTYGLASLDEARRYAQHPLLGGRLRACVEHVLAVEGRSVHDIFGSPDDAKLRSCLTLFAAARPDEPLFAAALQRLFDGRADTLTLARLAVTDDSPRPG